jgi:hypothetical protein
MAEPALMEASVRKLGSRARLHWLSHANHGFQAPKRSGRTTEDIVAEAAEVTRAWCDRLFASGRTR